MAAMTCMILNFNNSCINKIYHHHNHCSHFKATTLISKRFSPRPLKATPFLYSVAVFVWIISSSMQKFNSVSWERYSDLKHLILKAEKSKVIAIIGCHLVFFLICWHNDDHMEILKTVVIFVFDYLLIFM